MPGPEAPPTRASTGQAGDGLYRALLGSQWDELAPSVRRAHLAGDRTRTGRMDIRPGRWQAWRWLASRAGLPPPGAGVSTVVVVRVTNGGEEWRRTFAEHAMMTTQRIEDGLILERFNGLEVRFKLRPERGALRFEQRGARLCLGALRVPLPRWLAPAVVAHEGPGDAPDRTRVEVRITLPLFGEILSYSGWMGPPEEAA